ncbi:CPBP family intramembrane metalloprotease [Clostridium tyrobutyricum]|uniref:CPBP family intramembrane glutamic endopeptidase n=1 Tax=Clostridium tyrobutyricum TaxID=1519 RepID=UPI0002E6518C|nr:CPBP family intramembrane glutamic endopeptidase [Clostridium tyrobutyricum]MBR9647985.1 CPBP family intramembrane metalloprotease [Clostridium tyrobutyricum]MBV4428890.1 CPBP family intramembrane metalloprotease [Clostridium tyrobutyricum]MBV4438073.1 CPBP family intramembrane metalloprotease [Clostridium tyrobutyricum]MBV4444196.1 CPBP family intramembrane metalloprotease [Clostridium tyrobutyricum]MBV4446446.1 CPBP family intramembrane metalloprotease [Clostridium tyrobutyricum]
MINLNLIKNIIVFLIAYIPPIVVFDKYWIRDKRNKVVLFIINILFIGLSMYTQNIVPFIFVIINIVYMRFTDNFYKFDIKKFNIIDALRLAAISYLVVIIILLLQNAIENSLKIKLDQQEIVTNMTNMSLNKLVFMVPVVVIFAPVLEEFVFRWIFFEKIFKSRLGVLGAALLSSLMFSLVHFNINVFFIILWIGIYNCYLIHKKGYWYAVINHAVFNSVTMISLIYSKI